MVSILDDVQQPHNFNPSPAPFGLLVQDLFLKLDATNSENKAPFATVSGKKTHIIEQFISTWRTHFGADIYPAVQLIFPNRDPRKYFIKDVALARLVTKLLDLQKGSSDQTIIQNWKKSHLQKSRLAGPSEQRNLRDFPVLVSRIISRRRDKSVRVSSSVSVADVNGVLDQLSAHTSAREQIDILRPFVARLTIEEVRFFFSILLKESMLSFFERTFLVAWHPDAYDLYKVCSDLQRVVWAVTDPAYRLSAHDLQIHPMHQFIPQSSKKLDISYESLCTKMAARFEGSDSKLRAAYTEMGAEGKFLIEEKLDGDRILMHMQEGRFVWHTRRRRDYTMVYGENVHIGALTKHLSAAFHHKVWQVVLDGEMVAWDKERHVILPFGTLRSAAIQEALKQFDVIDVYEGNNAWPFYIAFDILHLNGQDLTNLPLFYRKKLLSQVLRPVPHRFEVLEWVLASSPGDLKRNMQQIVSDRNEGIMVKSLLSKYRVSSRESTWIKVKPEYLEDFGENLDLVVIGKIGRVKTSYMCGLRDEKDPGAFKSFCSVANGFSKDVYRQIESRLCNFWVDFRYRAPPSDLVQFGTKKPDFWINPANSIVLEIKARSIEVTAETPYAAGSTLHNLWCRSVREDKSYDECITLQEYAELKGHYSQDIYKKQTVNRDRRLDVHNSVYDKYSVAREPEAVSQLFRGLTFVVLTDARQEDGRKASVQETQRLIKEHGGKVRLNPKAQSLHGKKVVLIGEVSTPRVQSLMADGFDMVRAEWVRECIQRGRLVGLEPQFVFGTTSPELRRSMQDRVDKFGDSNSVCAKDKSQYLGYLMGLEMKEKLSERSKAAYMQATQIPLWRLFSGIKFGVFARIPWRNGSGSGARGRERGTEMTETGMIERGMIETGMKTGMIGTEIIETEKTEKEITETEMIETEKTEKEITETEMIETEKTEKGITETEMIETEKTEKEMTEKEMTNTEMTDTEMTDTEMTDTEMTNTEMTNTEMTDTEMTNTEMTDTEMTNTEMTDTRIETGIETETCARASAETCAEVSAETCAMQRTARVGSEETASGTPLYTGNASTYARTHIAHDVISRRIERRIQRFGGEIGDSWFGCGYIVVPQEIPDREVSAREIRSFLAAHYEEKFQLPYIVGEEFVQDSISERRLVEPENYLL